METRYKIGHIVAWATIAITCAVGIYFLCASLFSDGLEWRVVALAMLGFAAGPFTAEIRLRGTESSVTIPFSHAVTFAGAPALGPIGSAIPAAFCGISRLIAETRGSRPVYQSLLAVLKPSAMSASAGYVYYLAGGNVFKPYSVDSTIPLIASAVTYVTFGVLLAGATWQVGSAEHEQRMSARRLFAAWGLALFGGYVLAVLYATAPPYILISAAFGAMVAGYAVTREKANKTKEVAIGVVEEEKAEESDEIIEPLFVDPDTGIANQRYLSIFLQREIGRAARSGKGFTLAVFDVDSAQVEREDALRELALRLKSHLRSYDLVAFHISGRPIVVLPEISREESPAIAKRLHAQVTEDPNSDLKITASVGIAFFPGDGDGEIDLINAAHHALNQGRYSGQNSVHVNRKLAEAS